MIRSFFLSYVIIGLSGILTACSAIKDTGPDEYLNKARELMQQDEFQSAKLYIDSVRILFPKAFDKIRESIVIMREVNLSEQKRTLAYCDSMLKVKQAEFPIASKNFDFQKDAKFESIGHYVPKSQLTENNYGKTYLQSKVDEKGRLVLTSYYCGQRVLNYTSIKVRTNDGLFVETLQVPKDGALNYSFRDGSLQYEIIRFTNKSENGLTDFILVHQKSPLTVELLGERSFSYSLSARDKAAVADAAELSAILSDINRLLDEIRLSQAKIDYLYSKQQSLLADSIN